MSVNIEVQLLSKDEKQAATTVELQQALKEFQLEYKILEEEVRLMRRLAALEPRCVRK
jgi:hypothetical protein